MDEKQSKRQRIQSIREAMNEANGASMGKLPPQAIELEEGVLGALLQEDYIYAAVSQILTVESFYKEANARIYKAISELKKEGTPVDLLTVKNQLRKNEDLEMIGGPLYLSSLTGKVTSSANTETHARIVEEKAIARRMIAIANQVIQQAYEESTDVFDLQAKAVNDFTNCLAIKKGMASARQLTIEMMQELSERMTSEKPTNCVPSSITGVRNKIGGFYNTDLIIVAGRPGMGKTAYVLSEIMEAARNGKRCALFSLEMDRKQVMHRFVSQVTGIDVSIISKGKPNEAEMEVIHKNLGIMENLPIFINDNPKINTTDFRAHVLRLKQVENIDLVVVDYLQLMSGSIDYKGNRNAEISEITRVLKLTAKECDVPVVALSQLSRDVEKRTEKKPTLGDLRDSGSIEQDADLIMFPYRDHYYNERSDENQAEMIIAKNRSGSLGYTYMKWTPNIAKYSTWVENKTDDQPTPF